MKHGVLLVAHGSARDGPARVLDSLIEKMTPQLGEEILLVPSFLDHSPQTPARGLQQLAEADCERAVVVPLLLGAAYHLREDLPRQIGTSIPTIVTGHLGPHPKVIDALVDRLGPEVPARVVLVASGTTDSESRGETRVAANSLAERLNTRVLPAYVTAATPDIRTAVAGLRRQHPEQPVLLPYLLAEGLFSAKIAALGVELGVQSRQVIGSHQAIADLAVQRFHEAVS